MDFQAEWCGPSKQTGPALDDIAGTMAGKLTVARINLDSHPVSPGQYGVRGIPVLMTSKDGKLAATKVGATPMTAPDAWIGQNIRAAANRTNGVAWLDLLICHLAVHDRTTATLVYCAAGYDIGSNDGGLVQLPDHDRAPIRHGCVFFPGSWTNRSTRSMPQPLLEQFRHVAFTTAWWKAFLIHPGRPPKATDWP